MARGWRENLGPQVFHEISADDLDRLSVDVCIVSSDSGPRRIPQKTGAFVGAVPSGICADAGPLGKGAEVRWLLGQPLFSRF